MLAKDENKKSRLAAVLYNLSESIMIGASLLYPFMPETAEKIASQFNAKLQDFEGLTGFGCALHGKGRVVEQPQMLFARLDEKTTMEKVNAIMEAQRLAAIAEYGDPDAKEKEETEETPLQHKAEIDFDSFGTMEFRVGEVLECKPVEKSKKLLVSKVKIGPEVRQIVSGIRAYYTPEEMVGKKVMVLVNLKPAKLAGVLSEGMLLCAEDEDGKYVLMTPEKDVPSGGEIA